MHNFMIALLLVFIPSFSFSQNVLKENTWVLAGAKKNVYFEQGIFRLSNVNSSSEPVLLENVRTHYNKGTKQERIVIDFTGKTLANLYGSIIPGKKKITLDLMNVTKAPSLPASIQGKFLKSVDIYLIEPKLMSLELSFDSVYSFEIFYLLNPSRLVIDVKR